MNVEPLKSVADLFRPDPRMTTRSIHDRASDERKPYTINEHHERYASLRVEVQLPPEVASSWTTAQHLAIYGYFAYQFIPLALMQALTTLELALCLRMGESHGIGLRQLLERADRIGLIDKAELLPRNRLPPDALIEGEGPPRDEGEYWQALVEALAGMRNIFAHGTYALLPDVLVQMDIACRIIRQIYTRRAAA